MHGISVWSWFQELLRLTSQSSPEATRLTSCESGPSAPEQDASDASCEDQGRIHVTSSDRMGVLEVSIQSWGYFLNHPCIDGIFMDFPWNKPSIFHYKPSSRHGEHDFVLKSIYGSPTGDPADPPFWGFPRRFFLTCTVSGYDIHSLPWKIAHV
jgi:hypothetical protein